MYFEHNRHFVKYLFFQSVTWYIGFQYKFYQIPTLFPIVSSGITYTGGKFRLAKIKLVYPSRCSSFYRLLHDFMCFPKGLQRDKDISIFFAFSLSYVPILPLCVLCHTSISLSSNNTHYVWVTGHKHTAAQVSLTCNGLPPIKLSKGNILIVFACNLPGNIKL